MNKPCCMNESTLPAPQTNRVSGALVAAALAFLSATSALAQIPAGYKIETVELPKGAVTILGLCHKPDGTLAVVSWEGEVWEYRDETWTRFAENLMEPNGIYYDVKEDAYYVAQKPEPLGVN